MADADHETLLSNGPMSLQTLKFHHEFLRDRIDQGLQSVAEDAATHQQDVKKHVMNAKSARMFQLCASVASLFGISTNFIVLKVNEVFLLCKPARFSCFISLLRFLHINT